MSGTCISMVSCATDTETRDVSVERVLEGIRSGKELKGPITQIRNRFEMELATAKANAEAGQNVNPLQVAKLAVSELKKQLPGVTWSGTFSYRASDKLLQHSGLQCGDLDELGQELSRVREQLQTSPRLYALFLSPSGNGLKAVFRVRADASKHAGSYRAVEKHVRELTGVQIDQSGKDVSRLCFLSHDPEIYVNENAQELEPLPEPVKPKASVSRSAERDSKPSKAEVREMLAVIPKRPGYHDWIKLCAAVSDALPDDEAIEVLNEWSPEEAPGEYAKKLQSGFEKIHVGTLIHLARQHGWTPVDQAKAAQSEPKNENNEDATIARLAALSRIEYDRIRKQEAKKLKCRKTTLDSLVDAKRLLMRPQSDGDNLQGTAVKLADVEPWPEPVNGDEVLDAIAKRFENYVVLPEGVADMLSLWCAHTYLFKLFQKSPRIYINAPTEECGKSTLLNCCSRFCARAKRTDNMTTAVMFRLVSGHSPTILADECDKWLFTNGELVGLVQSGAEKGGTVMRCEGDSNDLREFGCYAPFVLAAIGKLPSQLHSRSICIRLKRARKEEIKQRSVFDFEHVEDETELNRKLARWTTDNRERIASCNPKLPEHLFNRIADNWRPLFAIAEVAGGDWPKRCADALVNLTTGEDERENLRVMLLADIQQILAGALPPPPDGEKPSPIERIFSRDLVEQLAELKERPWPEICRGKPITAQWLARNLAAFGIHSGNIRIGEEQAKGYERVQFDDVFARYVPEIPQTSAAPVPPSRSEVKPEILAVPKDEVGTGEKTAVYEALGRWDGSPTGEGPRKGRI